MVAGRRFGLSTIMSVYWDSEKKRWRYAFVRRVNGQRYRSSKLLPKGWSKHQAEKYDRDESARLYAVATGVEKPRLMLAPAVALYLEHRCPKLTNGKKAAQDLAHLKDEIEVAYLDEVADLSTRYIEAHPELSDGTLHNRLAYLRAAVNYARKRHGYGRGLPHYGGDMTIPTPDNERQVYAKLPELARLWKAFTDDEACALFRLVFFLGLRWRAELLTRTPEHIDRKGREVWLEIGKTKNGDPVMKFVHPAARDALSFIPFARDQKFYYDRWHEAVDAIGRPELKPHDLRHSLASEVISRPGGNLDDVRAALHHKSLQAAARYAHRYPSRAKAVILGIGGQKITHPAKAATIQRKRKSAVSA